MNHEERAIDKWLKYAAIGGPLFGFIFGNFTGAEIVYQAFKQDHNDIVLLQNWKEKQEDFNRETISAISTLKEVVRRIK